MQRAPGIPHALLYFGANNTRTTRARRAAGMLSIVIVRLDRAIQYSEASVIESKGCGVLDTPLSRSMTGYMEQVIVAWALGAADKNILRRAA